jgi:hypothetical protein
LTHSIVSSRQLASGKHDLLAKQRADVATLGPKWFPLRDAVEADVATAAKPYAGDEVTDEARSGWFKNQPGLYLRMRLGDADGVADIRNAIISSKRDGFAACFLREPNERGRRGEDGGAFSDQPWNVEAVYAATRVLTDDWVTTVNDADELRLRALVRQYDTATTSELPAAVDIVTRARFLLLALDEDPPGATATGDGGRADETALQLVEHPVRVSLFDLKSGKVQLRVRRSATGTVIQAGERHVTDPEMKDSMQRQANNCAVAAAVDEAIGGSAH